MHCTLVDAGSQSFLMVGLNSGITADETCVVIMNSHRNKSYPSKESIASMMSYLDDLWSKRLVALSFMRWVVHVIQSSPVIIIFSPRSRPDPKVRVIKRNLHCSGCEGPLPGDISTNPSSHECLWFR